MTKPYLAETPPCGATTESWLSAGGVSAHAMPSRAAPYLATPSRTTPRPATPNPGMPHQTTVAQAYGRGF